jgi:hypothetical protein
MKNIITVDSTDVELIQAYHVGNDAGYGVACGYENHSPRDAAEWEGWTVIRSIYGGTNEPGIPVLATDSAGRLYVVCNVNGPWAVMVN